MKPEQTIKIKSNFIKKYTSGYPLISKESIINSQDLTEECTLLKLVDDKNSFIARGYFGKQNKGYGWILSRNENEQINREFFVTKLAAALEFREKLFKSSDTTAFRVFNGEGDGIGGITIDYFDGYYLISWYSEGIYTYKKQIIDALGKLVESKAIYQKKRFDRAGQYIEEDDFVCGEKGDFPIIVKENGVNFSVYLDDGAMVGVFLDQREVRRAIRDSYAKGKTVLNMFSYTGAFSVYAALGGASKTTSVDLAKRSLSKTIEQFSINEIDYQTQDIIVEDVFNYFKYAGRKNLKFDMVILDPPSFARSKKFTFSAVKDYTNLLKDTIIITEENGIIVASTNCSSFSMKKFKTFVDTAFRESDCQYIIVEEFSLPEDYRTIPEFKEGDYLKVLFVKKLK